MRTLRSKELELLRSSNPDERLECLRAITRRIAHGDDDMLVAEELLQIASAETDRKVREAWLGYMDASCAPVFVGLLEKWLGSGDDLFRRALVSTLGMLKTEKADELLLLVLREESVTKVRQRALRMLVRRASLGESTIANLASAVREEDWTPATRREYEMVLSRESSGGE